MPIRYQPTEITVIPSKEFWCILQLFKDSTGALLVIIPTHTLQYACTRVITCIYVHTLLHSERAQYPLIEEYILNH